MTAPQPALTWDDVQTLTGYSDADIHALTADCVGEAGMLTPDGDPTPALLEILVAQSRADRDD